MLKIITQTDEMYGLQSHFFGTILSTSVIKSLELLLLVWMKLELDTFGTGLTPLFALSCNLALNVNS